MSDHTEVKVGSETDVLRQMICGRIIKMMDDDHWLPRWKSAMNKLLQETSVSAIVDMNISRYGFNLPLSNGTVFPLEILYRSDTAYDAKAVVQLYKHLRVTEMQQLPPNLWATVISAVHNTVYPTCIQASVQNEFNNHLASHWNWIRILPTLIHPKVPLFVKGTKVDIHCPNDKEVGNVVIGKDGLQYLWVEHPIFPSPKVDSWGNVQTGVKPYWNGTLCSYYENPRTVAAFNEQISRCIQLCFRHHRSKCLVAQNLAKLVIDQAGKFHPIKPKPIVFLVIDPIDIMEKSVEKSVTQQCGVREWMWEYAHSSSALSEKMQRMFMPTDIPETNLFETVAETLTSEEVMDIILLLSDITYNVRKRRSTIDNHNNYGWMVAAVKVAKRIDAYEKYLAELTSHLGKNESDSSDSSDNTGSLPHFIKDLTNVIGEYSLLSALPEPLLVNCDPSVTTLTTNEADWNGHDLSET